MKEEKKFKIGDRVRWESNYAVKVGIVIDIVPAGEYVYKFKLKKMAEGYEKFEKYSKRFLSDGKGRHHDSYLILVKDKYLYWPIVSKLIKDGV